MKITRARVVIALLSVGLIVSSGVAVWAASKARTPAQVSAEAGEPEPSTITATVQKGPLASSRKFDGELSREVSLSVKAPAGASGGPAPICTFLPKKAGDEIRSGQALIEISGRPIIVLTGEFPAFRDMKEGDKGRDVSQFQKALAAKYGTPVTGTFDARTAADTKRLYSDLGYANATADGEQGPADPESGQPKAAPKIVSVPAAELLYAKSLPATVGKINAEVGLPAKDTIATLVGGAWRVSVPLKDGAKGLDNLPEGARLTFGEGPLEDKGTKLLGIGKPPAEDKPEGEENKGDPWGQPQGAADIATFAVDGKDLPDKPKVGAAQSVVVEFKTSPPEAVVVPVSALWRKAGADVVTVVDAKGERHDVAVTVHLNQEGLCAVTPKEGQLPVGAKVVVAERSAKK
ncbi:hypothetical protein Afil01_13540 [Actinorhabdospora filicis]|uniref:Peptidoglycan binding protein n=1 Tax=Actinorhabdospora filicis TaxID=1785913 RepID=A0A9W6SIP5_9ACTN|nr:hypothetical protein [Actinorhabdospora filicis]GLZ76547.1 hypothetical protein Afil01_13540 [Actinorhabdospora filicis]